MFPLTQKVHHWTTDKLIAVNSTGTLQIPNYVAVETNVMRQEYTALYDAFYINRRQTTTTRSGFSVLIQGLRLPSLEVF